MRYSSSGMTRPTILLFDIDGTLLSAGGAGKRAIEHAIGATVGQAHKLRFGLDGMTDRAIVRQALVSLGWPEASLATTITAILDGYVERLELELADRGDCLVYPGVVAVLEAARARGAAIALGLGTGNIRRGATLKLRRVALDGYFSFGGFGCDNEDRPTIIRVGAERGAAALGRALDECRVVVIGDTPRDVSAAQAIGADSIAVATGNFDCDALRAAGATYAFADLAAGGANQAIFAD